jgi:hypothetical protein
MDGAKPMKAKTTKSKTSHLKRNSTIKF